jgi:hypothetical protein
LSKIEVNAIEPQCGTNLTVGASGDTITFPSGTTVVNNGSQTGFGRTGTVDWDTTAKTASFTAVSGNGYFVNTTSGAVTMTMPSGSAGAIVSIQDYNKTFDTNNLTVAPASGEKINGGDASANLIVSTEGQGLTFVYVDSTVGWKTVHENDFTAGGSNFIVATGGTITECGNCRIHTFTGPGTFTVCTVAVCAANNIVSHLVVAGGGGGGLNQGGGGGAGGFREVKNPVTPYTASPLDGYPSAPNRVTVTAQGYPITVGGGGCAPGDTNLRAGSGSNSVFSTITSAGGGGGGAEAPGCVGNRPGNSGGSGGGGSGQSNPGTGGAGNTPPVSPAQGTAGGNNEPSGPAYGGGGGGGATVAGSNGLTSKGGNGGNGATSSINASSVTYAGGGGGGSLGDPGIGLAGPGGGGAGAGIPERAGAAGTANTGGGGGGGSGGCTNSGYNGGSGIVIIRYKFQ